MAERRALFRLATLPVEQILFLVLLPQLVVVAARELRLLMD
jgi:hypothetical protein